MADEVATLIFKAESGDLVKAEALLKRVEKQGKLTEKASDGLATGLKRAAVAFLGVVGAAAGMRKLVSSARSFDILNAQLKTATGSAENAKIAFAAIENFAATTPFQLNEVTEAFVKMRNLGLDPSEAALTSYGNTASAMGKSLNQMIEAVADAATGEFERLKEFGIKASSQGDNVSFTFQGVTKTVKKNADEISGYLRDLGDVNFAGAMAERAATLDGAISNLEDAWNSLFMSAAQDGAGDEMARQIRELADVLKDPETIKAAQTLANTIIGAFSGATNAIATTINMVDWLGESIAASLGTAAVGDVVRLEEQLAANADRLRELNALSVESTSPSQLESYHRQEQALYRQNLELEKRLETSKMLAELEHKSPDAPAQESGDVLGQFGLNSGGDDSGSDTMTEARARELERLRESFMTELELEKKHHNERLLQIDTFLAEKAIKEAEANEMRLQAEAEHAEKINEIKLEQRNKETEGFQNTLSMAEQYYAGLEGKEAAHMRMVLQGMRILSDAKKRDALKTATIKGYEGIQQAVASAPFPANLIPIAFATAQMAGNIAGITNARALGGQVMPDSPYLVGERGPELFVPGSQGNIVTNERLNRAGGEATESREVRVSFNINALDGANVEQVLSDQRGFIFSMINDAVNDTGRGALI